MIVLGDEGNPLDVAGGETDEVLPRLELQIDLIANEAVEPIHLFGVVSRDSNPRIVRARRRQDFRTGDGAAGIQEGSRNGQPGSACWNVHEPPRGLTAGW